jgi:glutamyl-tRNA reductase
MSVVVIGLSHRSAPVELRERFAFAESGIPEALKQLRDSGLVTEGVVLSTCNRVEIYAATALAPDDQFFARVKKFLIAHHLTGVGMIRAEAASPSPQRREGGGEEADRSEANPLTPALSPLGRGEGDKAASMAEIESSIYTFAEPHSLQHLFKVASGLDSMVIGETEIFGQLKDAYELAFTHKHTGGQLNKAFQRAFNVAKHIRTETNIQRGSVSVMSAAVELAEKIFTSLAEHEVLIIGAGETSEKTARALQSRGVKKITVTNRSAERATVLAAELGARTVPFEYWPEEFERIDIAISSTAATHHILDCAKLEPLMRRRRHRPLLLIDIAVPRDIDPAVSELDNVYLYNVDDLKAIADEYLKLRHEELNRCNQIIAEKVAVLLEANRHSAAVFQG